MKFVETRLKGTCVIELESVEDERSSPYPAIANRTALIISGLLKYLRTKQTR